jgi:hypothetical protein
VKKAPSEFDVFQHPARAGILAYNETMKMSFVPADLHLYTDDEGYACLLLRGEMVGRFRSQREAIHRFNELRAGLEKEHPRREPSRGEKHEAFIRGVGEALTRHNSLRNAGPKKRTGTRTFG